MALAAEELITRLSLQGRSAYTAELQAASRSVASFRGEVTAAGGAAESTFGKLTLMSGGLNTIIGVAKAGAVALGGLAVAGVFVANKLTDVAATADKAKGRYTAVFGGMTSEVDGFIANLQNKFGTPTDVLESTTAQFARMAENVGIAHDKMVPFATSLTQAGVDLAAFYNIDPSGVFTAIQRGVAGQMRGLKALGIVIKEEDVTQQAKTMGLGKNPTEAQRMMIRQQMIMQQIGVATRNLSSDSGTLGNQQRELTNRMHELEVNAGRVFTPIKLLAVEGLNNLLIPATQHLKDILPALQDDFSNTGGVMQRVRPVLGFLADGIHALTSGGPVGLGDWLDRILNTGAFFHTMIDGWLTIFVSLYRIMDGAVLPVMHQFAPLLTLASVNVFVLSHILGFLADHLDIARILMIPIVGYMLLMGVRAEYLMARTVALMVVERARNAVQVIRNGLAWLGITATEAEATAEEVQIGIQEQLLANMELLVASNQALLQSYTEVTGVQLAAIPTWEGLATVQGEAAVTGWAAITPYLLLAGLFIAVAVATYLVLDHFDGLRDGATRLFGVIWNNPFGKFALIVLGTATGVSELWAVIEYGPGIVDTATGDITGAFVTVLEIMHQISQLAAGMWDPIIGSVKGVTNAVLSTLETGLNEAIDLINPVLDLASYVPGDPLPDHIDHVSLPRLHSGGRIVAPGYVNMRPDEEMVGLPTGAQVVPLTANRTAPAGGSGDGGPKVIQLMVDRKVLAQVMIDGNGDIQARK